MIQTNIQDDIVKKILRSNEILKPEYYESLDTYTEGHIENANLSTKFNALSGSIMGLISVNALPLQNLIDILEEIENYAMDLEDEESKGQLAIMFFEGILGSIDDINRDHPKFEYQRIIQNNLGIFSKEICDQHQIYFS